MIGFYSFSAQYVDIALGDVNCDPYIGSVVEFT